MQSILCTINDSEYKNIRQYLTFFAWSSTDQVFQHFHIYNAIFWTDLFAKIGNRNWWHFQQYVQVKMACVSTICCAAEDSLQEHMKSLNILK